MLASDVQISAMERYHLGDVQRVDQSVYLRPWSISMVLPVRT